MADALVIKMVREVRKDLPRCGVPKLLVILKDRFEEHGIKMGRDQLYRLLAERGYLIRYRRRKVYTTDSNHPYRKYPNLIRDLSVLTCAGQLWVSDITYLHLKHGFAYLSIVTDAYSHRIIGYCLHPTLHSDGPINALLMASTSKMQGTLIHHSDRGVQYCCQQYTQTLESFGIRISMTENGDPYENAIAERINGILKTEFLLDRTFPSFALANSAVEDAIDRYNRIRPHASCDNLTPVRAHEQKGILKKHWRSKGEKKETVNLQK